MVIPLHLAEEVADQAVEQEHREEWILSKIKEGRSTNGLYPPDENTLEEYEVWKAQNRI